MEPDDCRAIGVVNAFQPVKVLPQSQSIRELFLDDPATPWQPAVKPPTVSWASFFLKIDSLLKFKERLGFHPLRKLALKKAVAWMRERFQSSDGLGAIFPPMIYTVIVLKCLGVPEEDPEFKWAMRQTRGPDDPRRRNAAAATLRVTGLGHRPHAHRPRRLRATRDE